MLVQAHKSKVRMIRLIYTWFLGFSYCSITVYHKLSILKQCTFYPGHCCSVRWRVISQTKMLWIQCLAKGHIWVADSIPLVGACTVGDQPISVSLSHSFSLSFSTSTVPFLPLSLKNNILEWGLKKIIMHTCHHIISVGQEFKHGLTGSFASGPPTRYNQSVI